MKIIILNGYFYAGETQFVINNCDGVLGTSGKNVRRGLKGVKGIMEALEELVGRVTS